MLSSATFFEPAGSSTLTRSFILYSTMLVIFIGRCFSEEDEGLEAKLGSRRNEVTCYCKAEDSELVTKFRKLTKSTADV